MQEDYLEQERDTTLRYRKLLSQFLAGEFDALGFERKYLATFKSDRSPMNPKIFEALDRLFAFVDMFVADETIREPSDVDEVELRHECQKAYDRLSSLLAI